MKIRKASINDINEIQKLYESLFEHLSNLQPDSLKKAKQDTEFIKSMTENENSDILLAENCGGIIGMAVISQQRTPDYTCFVKRLYTYVFDLSVAPAYRCKGTGKLLMNAVKEWSHKKGSEYIELSVLNQNSDAVRFYERENFSQYSIVMRTNADTDK